MINNNIKFSVIIYLIIIGLLYLNKSSIFNNESKLSFYVTIISVIIFILIIFINKKFKI